MVIYASYGTPTLKFELTKNWGVAFNAVYMLSCGLPFGQVLSLTQ